MDYVRIGNFDFSKIVCGTNAVYGRSHFSKARDQAYRQHFTDENIVRLMRKCRDYGINAIETSANERIFNIRNEVQEQTNSKTGMIASTRIDCTSEIKSHTVKCKLAIANRCEIVLIHDQLASQEPKNDEIPGLNRLIHMIHEAGLVAGISCHNVRIVDFCEKHHPEIDVYLFPLNSANYTYGGHQNNDLIEDRLGLIKGIDKTFIIMKALGAGKLPPAESLPFVFENIKDKDIVTIGFGSELEVEEDMEIYQEFCRKQDPERQ